MRSIEGLRSSWIRLDSLTQFEMLSFSGLPGHCSCFVLSQKIQEIGTPPYLKMYPVTDFLSPLSLVQLLSQYKSKYCLHYNGDRYLKGIQNIKGHVWHTSYASWKTYLSVYWVFQQRMQCLCQQGLHHSCRIPARPFQYVIETYFDIIPRNFFAIIYYHLSW